MARREVAFIGAVIAVGLLAGAAGAATITLLDFVEHLTYHYRFGTLLDGVTGAGPIRRVVGPMVGAALAGLGWWLLRRRREVPAVSDAVTRPGPLPRLAMTADAALQTLLVGSGASLGRENAPRQFAVALGDAALSRWSLTARDRTILLGCAAGAGLAAVYSVPAGGALFALRVVLRTWEPRAVVTALLTSGLAVAAASPVTHDRPELHWPDSQLSFLLTGVAVLIAPLALAVGSAFSAVMNAARARAIGSSWLLIPALAAAGLLVGVCSHWLPELPGNGASVLVVSLRSGLTLASAAALVMLKPLLTALFLRAGGGGGLLTPALATGAAAGAVIALGVNMFSPVHLNVPAVSLACAAGVLGITQKAPLWAALFVWELARPPWWLLVTFTAGALATWHLRRLARRSGIQRRLAGRRARSS